MKIAVVARHYWPRPGAASVRLQALVAELRERGEDVVVITAKSQWLVDAAVGPAGEQVRPISGDTETGVGLRRVLDLIAFAVRAWRILRRMRPDVVVSDPPPTSGLAGQLCGARATVYYIADSWAQMLGDGGGRVSAVLARIVTPLENRVMRRASLVIAVRENLAELARVATARNVMVAPYGTNLEVFTDEGAGWDDPWAGSKRYFLYAGNYGVIQGAGVFVEAAEMLWAEGRDFGVVFMGYGSDETAVAEAQGRNSGRFVALTSQPPEVAAAAYRGALAGLASMRPIEVAAQTRPAKALASIACGCPIIFAGAGPFADEVTAHQLGVSVPWNPAAVAEAMRSELTATAAPQDRAVARRHVRDWAETNLDIQAGARSLADRVLAAASR